MRQYVLTIPDKLPFRQYPLLHQGETNEYYDAINDAFTEFSSLFPKDESTLQKLGRFILVHELSYLESQLEKEREAAKIARVEIFRLRRLLAKTRPKVEGEAR